MKCTDKRFPKVLNLVWERLKILNIVKDLHMVLDGKLLIDKKSKILLLKKTDQGHTGLGHLVLFFLRIHD